MVKLSCLLCLILLDLAFVNGLGKPKNKERHIHVVDKYTPKIDDHGDDGHGKHIHVVDKNAHGHVIKGPRGKKDDDDDDDGHVGIYELKTHNMHANFTNWGATLMSLYLPDMHGQMADVVLGHCSVDDYKKGNTYMGATIGRVANRIGGAQFSINEKKYKLKPNEGDNMLHGGRRGFSNVPWKVEKYEAKGQTPSITFAYESPDGDQGFPGALTVKTTYTLNEKENTLAIRMTGKLHGDKDCPVNMVNHVYWNLAGHSSGTVLSHRLQISGSYITPVGDDLLPSGDIIPIVGTAYDFLKSRPISGEMEGFPDGYDINYVLNTNDTLTDPNHRKELHAAATLEDVGSGRKMEVKTNQLGMQLYTAGKLQKAAGKDGAVYGKFAGVCLETQGFPDAVNQRHFPSQIVRPGDEYNHLMMFKFSTAFSPTAVE